MLNPSSQQSAGATNIDIPYIGKPEKEFRGANLFFGALLIKEAVERIAKTFNLFPVSTSIREMIDKTNSTPTIRYMTDEEVMKYLIEVSNGKKE